MPSPAGPLGGGAATAVAGAASVWQPLELDGAEAVGAPPPAADAAAGQDGAELGPEEARQTAGGAEAGPDEAADAEQGAAHPLTRALPTGEVVAPKEELPALHELPLLLPPKHVVRSEQRRRPAALLPSSRHIPRFCRRRRLCC